MFGSVCSSGLVWLVLAFSLALYAITGGDGKSLFKSALFFY